MKTHSERLRHSRLLHLDFLEDRNLLSPVISAPAAEVRPDQVMVPFVMTFRGERTPTSGGPPPKPTGIVLDAHGAATQWGSFALHETHTLEFSAASPGVVKVDVIGGSAEFTLEATGETVTATYQGTGYLDLATPNHLEVDLVYTITGGSGLRKGEMSEFTVHLVTEDAQNTGKALVTASGAGTISLVAPPARP